MLGSNGERSVAEGVGRIRLLADKSGLPVARLALESQVLGVAIGRGRPFESFGFGLGELKVECVRQMGDNRVLRLQQIGAGVELFGPQVSVAAGVDELGVDPHLIAGGAWFLATNRPASIAAKAPAEAARLSIVVLPFANLSGGTGQDYLVDALTNALTTSLARIRDTFVIARNTAMTFKGKPIDAKAIGKDLAVRYVLEGSVQPSGDRMRVNAQLIDAGSGAPLGPRLSFAHRIRKET